MIDKPERSAGRPTHVATVAQTLAALVILGGIPAFPWLDDIMDILEKWLGYPVRARMVCMAARRRR